MRYIKYNLNEIEKFDYSLCSQIIGLYKGSIELNDIGTPIYKPQEFISEVWGLVIKPGANTMFSTKSKLSKYQIIIRYNEDTMQLTDMIFFAKWQEQYIKIDNLDDVLSLNKWIALYGRLILITT